MVAGSLLHLLKVWVLTNELGVYYVAQCGAKGYSSVAPVAGSEVNHGSPRCPLCAFASEGVAS